MSAELEQSDGSRQEKSGNGMVGLLLLALGSVASSFTASYLLTPSSLAESVPCMVSELSSSHTKPLRNRDQSYVELQDILITIGSEPATRYLKMKVSIITQKDSIQTVQGAEPVLMDAFVNYLRSIELSDFEDPGFYPHMRQELAHRSSLVMGSANSDGVLITEFLLR